ncbi:MAG: DUF5011 domain-containing protein [Lachnospiraceae bacterium]|nr:DUF5011 domain-containing protein [Lachnospiraceae bacterium]
MLREFLKRYIVIILVAAAVLVAVILCITAGITARRLKGAPLWEEMTIELGDRIIRDPAYYVEGRQWTIDHTVIDVSRANNVQVGDYEVKAINPFAEYIFRIHVRDTRAPALTIGESSRTVLKVKETYGMDVIGARAYDLSGYAVIKYVYNGQEVHELCFDEAGRYEITVRASDGNANRTEKTVQLFVDTPPEFYGLHDQYVLSGSSEEDLDPVFAKDEVDGGLTAKIKTDLSEVNFNLPGDYTVHYKVSDGYGLDATAESKIHVVSSEQTVKEHENDCVLSAKDLEYAVEEGFFSYKPLKEPDRKWVMDNCDRTLVNLYTEWSDGSSNSGSAFVYRVTPEYVYFVSVYHVTSVMQDYPVWFTFYDGSSIRCMITPLRLSAGNEASLFRIAVRDIPYHTFVRLKQAAEEDNIYDTVKPGTLLLEYCKNWRAGEIEELVKDVRVISFKLSDIQKQYVDEESYFAVTRESVGGMSGTAVFDHRGVLAGICSKTMYPLEEEETKFQDGCDFLLKVDTLSELMDRTEEIDKMEKRRTKYNSAQ